MQQSLILFLKQKIVSAQKSQIILNIVVLKFKSLECFYFRHIDISFCVPSLLQILTPISSGQVLMPQQTQLTWLPKQRVS